MVDARPSPRGLKRFATLLLWLGALAYISAIGEAIIGWPLGVHDSYLSELAARQYPKSWLFRLTDLLSGVAIVSGTLLFVRHVGFQTGLRRKSASIVQGKGSLRAGWGSLCLFRQALAAGLLTFALATIVDSTVTPLDCALSLPECREQIEAGEAGRYEWFSILINLTMYEDLLFCKHFFCFFLAHSSSDKVSTSKTITCQISYNLHYLFLVNKASVCYIQN